MMANKLVARTPGGLWRQLKRAFPKLRRMKQRVKKVRQFKKVQVCSVFFLYNQELTALGFEVAFQECSSILFLRHFACMCDMHRSRLLFKQSRNSVAWALFDVPVYTCCLQGSGCLFSFAQVTLHAMCLLNYMGTQHCRAHMVLNKLLCSTSGKCPLARGANSAGNSSSPAGQEGAPAGELLG
jgi:hypothetical protein